VGTPQELLDIREKQWRPRAEVVSLAAETLDQISSSYREQALRMLGRLHDETNPGFSRTRLLTRWPAVHVLATAGVAAEHYERATFWPKLIDILQLQFAPDPNFQHAWGEAFLANLSALGLPTFEKHDDAGTRYVGRILLHAGMPTYCLDDFFRTLSWKRSRAPDLTPSGFVSWAAAKAASSSLNVDVPVQRFVRYGDEFAVDVAERCFELLDTIAAGSSGEDVPLPQRFKEVARKLHEERGISRVAHDGATGATGATGTTLRPRLVLDPFGQGLILRLPPVGDAPDGKAIWVVTLGEDSHHVATESLWPGSTEPAPQTEVPISKPVRNAAVALAGREHLQLPMIVVDDLDPLLAFGDDCELIPAGLPLPSSPTWVLFPGDPDSLIATGALRLITESPLPPAWSGFSLLQVDLSDVTALSVAGSTRTVRKFEAARIETSMPVRGIRTATGLPVLAEIPRVHIPQGMAGADWDVTLHDSAGTLVARRAVAGGDDPNILWENVARPVVGSYTLRVRGPWGRGASRSFTLVEGLSVAFKPEWRRFVPGGLQPCAASISAAAGAELPRTKLEFGQRDRAQQLRVGARNEFRSLVVSPPHMRVACQTVAGSIGPSLRPLTLIREDVRDDPGELVLDVGAAAEPTLHVIASKKVIQTLTPRTGRVGIYRFDLAAVVDTVRDKPLIDLALSPDGELVIATIRPGRLFTSVQVIDDGLEFVDCVDVDGLTAHVYPTRAPWREPASLPVVDGRAPLPEWLINAGPLYVLARVEDPWVPVPIPEWPAVGGATFVAADGWIIDGEQDDVRTSMFLSGVAPLPSPVRDFGPLWTVRALLPSLGLETSFTDVANVIDAAIYSNPAKALGALTESKVPTNQFPLLMIQSGLAWANLADAHGNAAPPWTVRGALPAALLCAADSLWSEDEIDGAISICGDSVAGLLDGNDPHAATGRMDETADLLDREPGLREQIIKEAGLVPKGLLSSDARVIAAMELLSERRQPRLKWLTTEAHVKLRQADGLIRMIADPATQRAFDARQHRTRDRGWRVLPTISMAYALAARHASRGHVEAAGWIVQQRRPWADLAAVAPQLVTIDLIIAELTVGRRTEAEVGERE
jgi:hypothetical protein